MSAEAKALFPEAEDGYGLVLGLDACGRESTLALARVHADEVKVLRELILAPRTAAAAIVEALREIVGETPPAALYALVVVRGPGSFTGMRIGLSCAKALAEATGVPLVGVSRLAVLAHAGGSPWAALDAGRGNVYLREDATGAEQMLVAGAARLGVGPVAVCEERLAAVFAHAHMVAPPTAADAVRYAARRLRAGDWDDAAALDALYLWREEQMLRRSPLDAEAHRGTDG